jgi:hypothetical protein
MTQMQAMDRFQSALEAKSEGDASPFLPLNELVEATVGVKLFSVTVFDLTESQASRVYSNMPDAYPVLGTKPMVPNDWSACVFDNHRTFVANDIETIATVFPDHELIRSLGCESVINVPLILDGKVRASLNCLHEAGHYTPARVAQSETLKLPGLLCLLMWENQAHTGKS